MQDAFGGTPKAAVETTALPIFNCMDTAQEKRTSLLEEPGKQWMWKITLTVLCAIVGAIVVLYLFRMLRAEIDEESPSNAKGSFPAFLSSRFNFSQGSPLFLEVLLVRITVG